MTLVLPYPVADMADYEKYYDQVFIPEEIENVHPKAAITKRNRWLVEHSDLLIAYVRRNTCGAAACLKTAEGAGIHMIKI